MRLSSLYYRTETEPHFRPQAVRPTPMTGHPIHRARTLGSLGHRRPGDSPAPRNACTARPWSRPRPEAPAGPGARPRLRASAE